MSATDPPRLVVNVDDEAEPPDEAVDETETIPAVEDEEVAVEEEPAKRQRRLRGQQLLAWLRRGGTPVWLGLFLTAAGFGLIAYTWGKTAALTDVAAQVPYLVSGGLVGIGFILVGLLVVNIAVKRREALDRQRQLEELRDAVVQLRSAIEGDTDDRP